MNNYREQDEFTQAYVDCALWCTPDPEDASENPQTLDQRLSPEDLPQPLLDTMIADCAAFQKENIALLAVAGSDSQNGHDFWLTREGHGAGFWGRGYSDVGYQLTEEAKAYGNGSDEFYQHDLSDEAIS